MPNFGDTILGPKLAEDLVVVIRGITHTQTDLRHSNTPNSGESAHNDGGATINGVTLNCGGCVRDNLGTLSGGYSISICNVQSHYLSLINTHHVRAEIPIDTRSISIWYLRCRIRSARSEETSCPFSIRRMSVLARYEPNPRYNIFLARDPSDDPKSRKPRSIERSHTDVVLRLF
jgi:hypothetical protein